MNHIMWADVSDEDDYQYEYTHVNGSLIFMQKEGSKQKDEEKDDEGWQLVRRKTGVCRAHYRTAMNGSERKCQVKSEEKYSRLLVKPSPETPKQARHNPRTNQN